MSPSAVKIAWYCCPESELPLSAERQNNMPDMHFHVRHPGTAILEGLPH